MSQYSILSQDTYFDVKPEYESIAEEILNFGHWWCKIPGYMKPLYGEAITADEFVLTLEWYGKTLADMPEKLDKWQQIIRFWKRLDPKLQFDPVECHALFYLYDGGWIEMDDYCAKHYAQTLLPAIIKELMAPGQVVRLMFKVDFDENEDWGYEIDTRHEPATITELKRQWVAA